jgi:hypothetical protein
MYFFSEILNDQEKKYIFFRHRRATGLHAHETAYTVSDSKNGLLTRGVICQRKPLNLSQAFPSLKQPIFKKLSAAGGLKCNGYSTQAEPIFESRAEYTQRTWKIGFSA